LKHKRERQKNRTLEVKKYHIPPSEPAPGRREWEVRYCEVPCGVPEYRQPQPKAQAYPRANQGLATTPAFQQDNPHLPNGRKAGTDV